MGRQEVRMIRVKIRRSGVEAARGGILHELQAYNSFLGG